MHNGLEIGATPPHRSRVDEKNNCARSRQFVHDGRQRIERVPAGHDPAQADRAQARTGQPDPQGGQVDHARLPSTPS
jgi:hypothetical protein